MLFTSSLRLSHRLLLIELVLCLSWASFCCAMRSPRHPPAPFWDSHVQKHLVHVYWWIDSLFDAAAAHRSQISAEKRERDEQSHELHFILSLQVQGNVTIESQQWWDCLNISHWICSYVHCLHLCSLLLLFFLVSVSGGRGDVAPCCLLDAFVSFKSHLKLNFGTFLSCKVSEILTFVLFLDHVKSVPLLHKEYKLEINTFVVYISCFFAANYVTDPVSYCVNVFLSRMLLIK